MAQVDFVNYFSILFWFYILFIIYYIINYSFFLPSLYTIIFIRYNLYKKSIFLLKSKCSRYIKNYFFNFIIKNAYNTYTFFHKKWICV